MGTVWKGTQHRAAVLGVRDPKGGAAHKQLSQGQGSQGWPQETRARGPEPKRVRQDCGPESKVKDSGPDVGGTA